MAGLEEIRARLSTVGLTVSNAELDRLGDSYAHLQSVLAGFVALGPARYETPAMRYGPPGPLSDWTEFAEGDPSAGAVEDGRTPGRSS
jgi:hypothetical protein